MKKQSKLENVDPSQVERPACHFCAEEKKKTAQYSFWAGYHVKTSRSVDLGRNVVNVQSKYRDMQRFSLLACRDCQIGLWRKYHLWYLVAWGIPFVICALFAVFSLVLIILHPNLLPFILIALILLLMPTWEVVRYGLRVCVPSLERSVMEAVVLSNVRSEFKEHGDSFFTNTHYREVFH